MNSQKQYTVKSETWSWWSLLS